MSISKKRVESICRKKFKKCSVDNIRKIVEAGAMNPVYEITISNPEKSLILRTFSKKWEHFKPDKEKYVFELINNKTDLPVPEIYVLDKSKKIIPKTYLLMSKLEGIMPKKVNLSSEEKKKLYYQLGKDLAKLHKIKFEKFGWIYKNKISKYELKYGKPFDKWKDCFFSKYEEVKEEIRKSKDRKYGKLNKASFEKLLPKIDEYIKNNEDLLEGNIKASFIHNDFSLENMLVKKNKNWKISGIFDVEVAMTGHSEFELANVEFLYYKKGLFQLNKNAEAFMEGYRSVKKLSKKFEKRKNLYLLYGLLSCVSFDGFELGNANKKTMYWYYNNIKQILKNG